MKYTINTIDENGIPNITYTLSDGSTNTESLGNAVGLSLDDLNTFLEKYVVAFEEGKAIENQAIPDKSVLAVVGKQQDSIAIATQAQGVKQGKVI